jgi:hypothetical protein
VEQEPSGLLNLRQRHVSERLWQSYLINSKLLNRV